MAKPPDVATATPTDGQVDPPKTPVRFRHGVAVASSFAPPINGPCVQHPETPAAFRCDRCRALMCPVCEFSFPGSLRVCPVCVATPDVAVSVKRTVLSVIGMVLSALSVAFLGSFMSGMMQFQSATAAGYAFLALIFLPAALGLAFSYAAMDRNRGNNALLWISSALSSLELAATFALIIYGNLKG